LSGNALLQIIDKSRLYNSRIERFVLSYGLGVFIIAIIQLYALFIKLPLNKTNILFLLSPFVLVKLFYFIKRARTRIDQTRERSDQTPGSRVRNKRIKVLEVLLIVFIVLLCLIMLSVCLLMPMYTWDSRATWGFKAKILFQKQSIFTDDFLDPSRYHTNTRYPILIPLIENYFYNMLGAADDYLVKVIFALFYLALILFLYVVQTKYFSITRLHSLIFTAVFVSLPFLFVIYNGSVPSAFVDFPLACFFTLSMMYIFLYMKTKNIKHIILASLFSCAGIFSKNEGIALFLLSILVLLIDSILCKYLSNKKNIKSFLIYVFLPILILIPWFLIRSKLPIFEVDNLLAITPSNFVSGFPRLGLILKLSFLNMFTNLRSWGIIWPIVIMTIFINFKQKQTKYYPMLEKYLLAVPLVYYFLILTPIYMFYNIKVYPLETLFGIEGANFERLRLHTFPLLMLFVSLRISRIFNQK